MFGGRGEAMYRVTQLWVSTLINKQPDCSRSSGALCDHLAHLQAALRPQQQLVFGFQLSRQAADSRQGTCHMSHVSEDQQHTESYVCYCLLLSFNTQRKPLLRLSPCVKKDHSWIFAGHVPNKLSPLITYNHLLFCWLQLV